MRKGLSELIPIERDLSSKRNGYTAQSYLKIIKKEVPKNMEKGMLFL